MSALRNLPTASRRRGNGCQAGEQGSDQRHPRSGSPAKAGPVTVRELGTLLREFEATLVPAAPAAKLFKQHQGLLEEFDGTHTFWEHRQVSVAEGFNILRTMRLTTKELCHSNILAWLLDHRLEGFGTHAQGKCGFRLFLEKLDLPPEFGDADYRVARELRGEESQLDIVIEANGDFIIGIENKVASKEILGLGDAKDQTQREWADLKRRGAKLHVPPPGIKAFFLTPDSQPPRSRKFTVLSWRLVADVFEAFAAKVKPPIVKLFAQHYAETLRRDVVSETTTEEEENE